MTDPTSMPIAVTDSVDAAGPYLDGQSAELAGMLAALRTQLIPLEDTWKGSAKVEYAGHKLAWDTAANGLFGTGDNDTGTVGILPMIATALKTAALNYGDTEGANTRSWTHH